MIGSSENRISYNGNGIATEFAYTFKILEKSDMKVLHVAADGTETLLTKDYYVDMEKSVVLYPGYAPGEEIPEQNRPPILSEGEMLVLYREVLITQESALDKHWPFNVIEAGLDKLTIICQQIWDRANRSFYVSPATNKDFNSEVPIAPGKTFRVKDDGTGFEVTEDPGKVIDGATALLKQTTEQAVNAQNAATHAEVQAESVKKYKALWFDSVASMKAEPSLTAGAYVCTAGYYEPNDGGGASYLIRAKADADTGDGGSIHELSNGLVAELIIENDTVNINCIGAMPNTECGDKLQYAVDNFKNIIIPSGNYYVSSVVKITKNGVNISGHGEYNSRITFKNGTASLLLQGVSSQNPLRDIRITNLGINRVTNEKSLIPKIDIQYSMYITLEDLFLGIKGNQINIYNTYDCRFHRLNIWGTGDETDTENVYYAIKVDHSCNCLYFDITRIEGFSSKAYALYFSNKNWKCYFNNFKVEYALPGEGALVYNDNYLNEINIQGYIYFVPDFAGNCIETTGRIGNCNFDLVFGPTGNGKDTMKCNLFYYNDTYDYDSVIVNNTTFKFGYQAGAPFADNAYPIMCNKYYGRSYLLNNVLDISKEQYFRYINYIDSNDYTLPPTPTNMGQWVPFITGTIIKSDKTDISYYQCVTGGKNSVWKAVKYS